ncbi:MAG: hypothetical protein O3B86_12480, partial [Planctomycetota bacterium]|nr:hypothetical protein [Planctomycetota bacterium]
MSHSGNGHGSSAPPLKMGLAIPNSKLCMWLFLGTEIMFFTAFIGSYIVLRIGSPGWPSDPKDTHILVLAGGINTFVLILSSYLVVLSHEAMIGKDYRKAWKFMAGTMALAFVFLGIKSVEYYGKFDHDIVPGHIAENDEQALTKLARECTHSRDAMAEALYVLPEGQTKVPEVIQKIADLLAELDASPDADRRIQLEAFKAMHDRLSSSFVLVRTNADGTTSLNSDPAAIKSARDAYDAAVKQHEAVAAKGVVAGTEAPAAPAPPDIVGLSIAVRRELLPLHTGIGHELNPLITGLLAEMRDSKSNPQIARYFHAHDPHPMVYGNVFASTYFLMTGFHA